MPLTLDYIAGFFDGEGCMMIVPVKQPKDRITANPRLGLCQKRRAILDMIQAKFGGFVSKRNPASGSYSLVFSGKYAAEMFWKLANRLVVKADEAVIFGNFIRWWMKRRLTYMTDWDCEMAWWYKRRLKAARGY